MQTNYQPTPNFTDYDQVYQSFSWKEWESWFSFKNTNKVNYAYEVTDAQVQKGKGALPAFLTQKPSGEVSKITFKELADVTNRVAAVLQSKGLKPGDRFGIYASKSIDYAIVLFAALKCGAVAVPIFSAFGKDAIADRLNDCGATWLYVTKDLLPNVSFEALPTVACVLSDAEVSMSGVQVFNLENFKAGEGDSRVVVFGDLETPFIIHYTSGSTGKPKGILLSSRAMIGHLVTALYVLDLHSEDIFWNTGDPGWVTGMVYNFFAPLLLGVAAHLYEGPFHAGNWVKFMKERGVSVWYSTPTAFRLLRYYNVPLNKTEVPTIRHIVSAGEPLNPALISWTEEQLGVSIYDSWYMTENGHQLINNYRCLPIKKGSMGKPLPGIYAAVIDDNGDEVGVGMVGRLAVRTPWPGLMQTVWGNQLRFQNYFQGQWYISGDTAYKDKDGYFWFQGREDDMIKSAAERIGPFEIESVLVSHPSVAEAGVIGKPDEVFGQIIKAFVLLKPGIEASGLLKSELTSFVRDKLAAHEVPREIEFVTSLPKTKSGKIMRRVLRAREMHVDEGDLSTLDAEMDTNTKQ